MKQVSKKEKISSKINVALMLAAIRKKSSKGKNNQKYFSFFIIFIKSFCLLQVTTSPAFERRKQSLNSVIFLHMSKYLMKIFIYSLVIRAQVLKIQEGSMFSPVPPCF